jgi:hypothetical protein
MTATWLALAFLRPYALCRGLNSRSSSNALPAALSLAPSARDQLLSRWGEASPCARPALETCRRSLQADACTLDAGIARWIVCTDGLGRVRNTLRVSSAPLPQPNCSRAAAAAASSSTGSSRSTLQLQSSSGAPSAKPLPVPPAGQLPLAANPTRPGSRRLARIGKPATSWKRKNRRCRSCSVTAYSASPHDHSWCENRAWNTPPSTAS